MARKPTLQALVLADHVYIDRRTSKSVIAGTFRVLYAPEFPAQFPRTTWAYICLTDIQGKVPITLSYTDLKTNEVLLQTTPQIIESGDPIASVEWVIEVPPFPMPHAGAYVFEVYAGEGPIGSLRIQAKQIPGGVQ